MNRAGSQRQDQHVFVLRWDHEQHWGHLAVHTGHGRKPAFIGVVNLDCDRLFAILAREYSLPLGSGLREVWFTGTTPQTSPKQKGEARRVEIGR